MFDSTVLRSFRFRWLTVIDLHRWKWVLPLCLLCGCGGQQVVQSTPQAAIQEFTKQVDGLERVIDETAAAPADEKEEAKGNLSHRVGELEETFQELAHQTSNRAEMKDKLEAISRTIAQTRAAAESADLAKVRENVQKLKLQSSELQ